MEKKEEKLSIHEKTMRLMCNRFTFNHYLIEKNTKIEDTEIFLRKARLFSLMRLLDYGDNGFNLTITDQQIQQIYNAFTEEQLTQAYQILSDNRPNYKECDKEEYTEEELERKKKEFVFI